MWVFEPTSFLQLVAEPLQFSELLDKVVASEDPHDKMSYLVAFTAAYYSQMVRSSEWQLSGLFSYYPKENLSILFLEKLMKS